MVTSIPLAVLFAAAAAFSLYELIRFRSGPEVESYIADREAQAAHLLMNGGMAAMVSPLYDAAVERVIVIVFAAGVLALAMRLIASLAAARGGHRAAGTVYHLVGLAAMLHAARLMSPGMTMPGGMMDMASAPTNWFAVTLGALFALDGIATLVLAGFMPKLLLRMEASIGDGEYATPASLRAIRASAFPHVVMDFGMVLMLLPTL